MTSITYIFLLLCLWGLPVCIGYRYLKVESTFNFSFLNIFKLATSFLVSLFLIQYIIKYFFILFLVFPLFILIIFINLKITSDSSSSFLHFNLAVDLSHTLLFLLMLFSTFFGIISNENAMFFLYYGPPTLVLLFIVVLLFGIPSILLTYARILPKLIQVPTKETKTRLWIVTIVKVSYSILVIFFLQDNLHMYRADVYIIVVVTILLGFVLNLYLFSSISEFVNLTIERDNLAILKEHYTTEEIRKKELSDMEKNIQILRHDLKQLVSHFESVNTDSVAYKEMVEELRNETDKNTQSPINYSDHDLLNSYLYRFNKLCEEAKIDFDCTLIWSVTDIDPFDSIRLFSNLLTNSFEAVSKLEPDKRSITVNSALWNDTWLDIRICNPFDHPIHQDLKSSKLNHEGIGINQIKKIVEDNHGLVEFEIVEQQFCVLISLPISS